MYKISYTKQYCRIYRLFKIFLCKNTSNEQQLGLTQECRCLRRTAAKIARTFAVKFSSEFVLLQVSTTSWSWQLFQTASPFLTKILSLIKHCSLKELSSLNSVFWNWFQAHYKASLDATESSTSKTDSSSVKKNKN